MADEEAQQCIFCKIISGEVPSRKIYEDNIVTAILDINPANLGHILLLPKNHYQIMPQVPEKELAHMFKIAKYLSNSILKAELANSTTVFVANGAGAGQKAPHFIVHIIPRKKGDGLLEIPKRKASEPELEKVKEMIIARLKERLGRDPVSETSEAKEDLEKSSKIEEPKKGEIKEGTEKKAEKKEQKKKKSKKASEKPEKDEEPIQKTPSKKEPEPSRSIGVDLDKLTDLLGK
jgi:histidine triad (HIT) family protein